MDCNHTLSLLARTYLSTPITGSQYTSSACLATSYNPMLEQDTLSRIELHGGAACATAFYTNQLGREQHHHLVM